jgi:hypothetical protein
MRRLVVAKEKGSKGSQRVAEAAESGSNTPRVPAARVPAEAPDVSAGQPSSGPHTATVNLPFVTATFRAPQLRPPHVKVPQLRVPEAIDPRRLVSQVGGAATVVRGALPPPKQLAYYTGLGVLAVAEIVEWPVALAIGAGTVIAQQGRGAQQRGTSTAGTQSATGSSE